MKYLDRLQRHLEDTYGAPTGVAVSEFAKVDQPFARLGEVIVAEENQDLSLAILLDRDVHACWAASAEDGAPLESDRIPMVRALSVPFEEISHFVYLGWNHNRGRSVTTLEMEIQGEIDRIVLGFHAGLGLDARHQDELLGELLSRPYAHAAYEESREVAARFLRRLSGGDPRAWTTREFEKLRRFFHSDLGGKIRIAEDGR